MQFRVLGPLEVDVGHGPVPLGGPKQRAVLATLLTRANQVVPADALIDEVWGEQPPEKARNTLQTYISNLRKALGEGRLQGRSPGYILAVDPSELDAKRFDGLVREARKALPVDPTVSLSTLDDALALWRGPALADLTDQPSLVAEAARLDELRIEAQEDRVAALLASGDPGRAIGELEVLLAQYELRESLWAQLMLALYRDERQADALNAFQRAREMLADELGIDPSPELVKLHERILRQDPDLELRGERLRGYRLLEKIDEGPLGVTFRAIQPHLGRDVVVTIVHERIATAPSFVRRFEPDAQAVAALEHPNIVPIFDYWREPGRAHIVSRFLRGGSLAAAGSRGPGAEWSLRLVEQVSSALSFAHRQGVIHRLLDASAVRLDAEGNAYLGGFSIGADQGEGQPEDVRALALIAKEVLGDSGPPRLLELVEQSEETPGSVAAEDFARAARAALEPSLASEARPADERNPYKGLRAFSEVDARDFFGREGLTHTLLARIAEGGPGSRFLAVVGPSGSGKSSIVRAGMIPAIRSGALGDPEQRSIAEMFPGAHPIDELEAALLRVAVSAPPRLRDLLDRGSRGLLDAVDLLAADGEIVLVVDQLEEVFTLTVDERERDQFLESLRVATVDPDSKLRVIVTLRADFFDRPLLAPRFGELLASRNEAIPALTPDELEQAIRKPAEGVGVHLEPGLIADMVADVAHQPGALPLVQFALTELFDRRESERLGLDTYREIGGVAGALSARADRLYEMADTEGRRAIQRIFLRLVTLGEDRQDTRRRVGRAELDLLDVEPEAIERTLETFGRHRLLTFDRDAATRSPTVEIAHEALLSSWGRARLWIDDAREDLRQLSLLARAESEWRSAAHDPSFLLRGARLEQAEAWTTSSDLPIGPRERTYVKASIDQRDHERTVERERRAHEVTIEGRSRRLLRALVAVFAVAALVAGLLTVVATRQSERAEREATVAAARELAAASLANLDVDAELGVLLAMEAVERTRSAGMAVLPEAEDALHQAVAASRIELSVPDVGGSVAWGPGVFVTQGRGTTGMIDLRDTATGAVVRSIRAHDAGINDVAFAPVGSILATAGDDGMLKIWEVDTGRLLVSVPGVGGVRGLSFSGDGSLLAGSWPRAVRVMNATTGHVVASLPGGVSHTALSPDGQRIAVPSKRGTRVVDLPTGRVALDLVGQGYGANAVAWSPDGRSIATVSQNAVGEVWDAATGELRYGLPYRAIGLSLAWSPDSSRVATGGSDGFAKVWELGSTAAQELVSVSAQDTKSGIADVAFSPDGKRILTGDAELVAAKIWDAEPADDAELANFPVAHWLGDVAFSPDGRFVAASSGADSIRGKSWVTIWDPETNSIVRRIGPIESGWPSFDLSPDGRSVAVSGGPVTGWDVASGDRLFVIPNHQTDMVDWSPGGDHLVLASFNEGAVIVDRSGRRVAVLREEDGDEVIAARFSPDGRMIATAVDSRSRDHIAIWDWRHGDVLRTIATNDAGFALAFDPNGSRIVTGGLPGRAGIWNVGTGTRIAALGGRSAVVMDVAFSPDGSRVAVGGFDHAVRLFDAASGEQQLVLRHDIAVSGLAFSPDGSRLASFTPNAGPSPGRVRIWALDVDELLRIARGEVTRSLTREECRRFLHVEDCRGRLSM